MIKRTAMTVAAMAMVVGWVGAERPSHARAGEAKDKFVPLFNGETFEGWNKVGGGHWEIEDGVIHGTSPGAGKYGYLVSERTYRDFVVRLKFKILDGNSGFFFRVHPDGTHMNGFQAEIGADHQYIGGLYESGGRGWVVKPDPETVKKAYKPGKWNRMTVRAVGDRIVVRVNGVITAKLEGNVGNREGHLAFQLHRANDMNVKFKDVMILKNPKGEEGDAS